MEHFTNNPVSTNNKPKLSHRPLFPAMKKGFFGTCPKCGEGKLFNGFLKVQHTCSVCGEELHHQRADDAPAYFTIAIVGKIVVGLYVWMEFAYHPPYWLLIAIFLPLTLIMALSFLPLAKGALIGLQWSNYMHGFDPNHVEGSDIEVEPTVSRDANVA